MKLYDDVICLWNEMLSSSKPRRLELHVPDWKDAGNNNMVFQRDTAFCLGGDRRFESSSTVVTESPELVPEDEDWLIGPDIPQIKEDRSFARLSIIRVQPGTLPEGDLLIKAIKKIGLTRYYVNPEGYMLRISSGNGVESVRVSKKALQHGLTFSHVAKLYSKAYHQNPSVAAVRTIFITADSFDFDQLKASIRKADDISKAIDHIHQLSLMDCEACSLQKVCDEVEGLRELHFHSAASK